MESLVTELVWLVTNFQAWVVWGSSFLGILTFGTAVTRSSRSLRCARTPVPPPPLDAKTFKLLSFSCSTCSGCRGLSVVLAGGSIRRSTPPPLVTC